jgi:hypothetical protein
MVPVDAPPRLLLIVMLIGLVGELNWALYVPPPLLVSVPIVWPVDVTATVSVALVLVLVASTLSTCLAVAYCANLTVTVSAGAGGVDVPLVYTSALAALPVTTEPPATTTWPLGSSVAV